MSLSVGKLAHARRAAQRGFTLVEMAIVLVIIGLIVGGILKGQEIVNNGRVKTQVAQVDAVKAAVNTFVDRFNFFPGDFPNANSVFGLDASYNGNGDGIVGGAAATLDSGTPIPAEMEYVWVQLQAANLISSVPSHAVYAQDQQWYEGKLPTAYLWFGDFQYGAGATAVVNKMVMLEGSNHASVNPTPGARMSDALSIDTKYDDGLPGTGQIFAGTASSANNCCHGNACSPALAGTANNSYGLNPGGGAGNAASGNAGAASCTILWQIE